MQKITNKTLLILLIMSILLIIVHRVFFLKADGDLRISKQGMWLTDEGMYSYPAANWLLFGELIQKGDQNCAAQSPTFTFSQILFFKIADIGIAAARLHSIFWLFIGLLLLAYKLHNWGLGMLGLFSIVWSGTSYYLFTFQRLALVEPMQLILFLIFCLLLVERELLSKRRLVLLGVLVTISAAVKISGYILFAVGLSYLYWESACVENSMKLNLFKIKRIVWFAGSVVISYALWFIFWILPHIDDWLILANANFVQRINPSLTWIVLCTGNLIVESFFCFSINAHLIPVCFLCFLWWWRERKEKKASLFYKWITVLLFWCVYTFLALILLRYQSPRFTFLAVFPLYLFSAAFYYKLLVSPQEVIIPRYYHRILIILAALVIILLISFKGMEGFWAYTTIVIVSALFIYLYSAQKEKIPGGYVPIRFCVVALLVIFSTVNLWFYVTWANNRKYSYIHEIERCHEMIKDYPYPLFLAGSLAMTFALEWKCRAISIIDTLKNHSYPVSHVFYDYKKQQEEMIFLNKPGKIVTEIHIMGNYYLHYLDYGRIASHPYIYEFNQPLNDLFPQDKTYKPIN